MSYLVNISARDSMPWVVFLVLVGASCAGRPGLSQVWFDPTTAAFNARVSHPGTMPPLSREEKNAAIRSQHEAWSATEVKRLEKKLSAERRRAGISNSGARARTEARDRTVSRSTRPKKDRRRKTTRRATSPNPKRVTPAPAAKKVATTARTQRTRPNRRRPTVASPAGPVRFDGASSTKRWASDGAAMGDGSTAGEWIAAARRLMGLVYDEPRNTFLRHLLVVGAVDLSIRAPPATFDVTALAAMRDRGWFMNRATAKNRLRAGDVVVFDAVTPLVAVVESVDGDGVATCIGPRFGRVQRFVMSLRYPKARRNEATGRWLNATVTSPGVASPHRPTATLAGELFRVAIRPPLK